MKTLNTKRTNTQQDYTCQAIARAVKGMFGESEQETVKTGFSDLDFMLQGLNPGELILLGGRPAMGKTAFALSVIDNMAIKRRQGCLLFSVEGLSAATIMKRMIRLVGKMEKSTYKDATLDEKDRIEAAAQKIMDAPVYVVEKSCASVEWIRETCKKYKDDDIKLIIVDYFQMLTSEGYPGSGDKYDISTRKILLKLKRVGEIMHCPILVLSEISRAVEEREEYRPLLTDLPGAPDSLAPVDKVLFLYRDEYYYSRNELPSMVPGKTEVIIASQKDGPVGTVNLLFQKAYGRFESLNDSGTTEQVDVLYEAERTPEALLSVRTNNYLREKYGEDSFSFIGKRVENELTLIGRSGNALRYLIASDLAQAAREQQLPIWFAGTIGSSLVAYLNGVTEVSPLPESQGGYDIPFETTRIELEYYKTEIEIRCPKAFMLPAQAAVMRQCKTFGLEVLFLPMSDGILELYPLPKEVYDKYCKDVPEDFRHKLAAEQNGIKLIPSQEMEEEYMLRKDISAILVEDIMANPDRLAIASMKVWQKMKNEDGPENQLIPMGEDFMGEINTKPCVRSFEDLINAFAIIHGTGVWNDATRKMFKKGAGVFGDLMTTRDDVFHMLVKYGFNNGMAIRVAEAVRRGQGIQQISLRSLKQEEQADYFLGFCEQVKYLFPKAHCAAYVYHAVVREICREIKEQRTITESGDYEIYQR